MDIYIYLYIHAYIYKGTEVNDKIKMFGFVTVNNLFPHKYSI